ncbi:MAG: DNA repair exonuclease [Nitrospirae bacterium]|nr:DNA repair exonuclease [Magnetococcales bacterium]
MKFIHAADLHLDAPLRGLTRYSGAPLERIRQASRKAFERLMDACRHHRVDFLLLAGDLLDRSGRDYQTVLYLATHLRRLKEDNIEVFIVLGNHDAEHALLQTNPFSTNIHLFASDRPHTIHREHLGLAVHGQSHSHQKEKRNLAADYPPCIPGAFNIGLLHTSLVGRDGHETYAPCSEQDLLTHGYQYWALGHVHQREIVRAKDPMILFPGTLQGRHIRESGEKGATLVAVDPSGHIHAQPLILDQVRWKTLEITLDTIASLDDILERVDTQLQSVINPDVLTVVRLNLVGHTPLHDPLVAKGIALENELRLQTINTGGDALWLEKVVITSRPHPTLNPHTPQHDTPHLDPLTMLQQIVQEWQHSDEVMKSLTAQLKPLRGLLGGHLFPIQEAPRFHQALEHAQALVRQRLLEQDQGDQ